MGDVRAVASSVSAPRYDCMYTESGAASPAPMPEKTLASLPGTIMEAIPGIALLIFQITIRVELTISSTFEPKMSMREVATVALFTRVGSRLCIADDVSASIRQAQL